MAESAHQGGRIIEDRSVSAARRSALRAVAVVSAIVALIGGALLLWFAAWQRPLVSADAAASTGNWKSALDGYAAAEAQFNDWPLAQRAFPGAYRAALANQLEAHYRMGNLDAVVEKGETVPATAASHFWVGSALFEKSKIEENPEARLGLLGRASDEFKAALELEPANWDVIYNYELTKRLFEELRKKPKTPPKQLLQLLRPQPKEGPKPEKKVG
jgi:hypothetical protein